MESILNVPSPVPHRRPWEEANPVISGVLAYLIPGAGHLYQGRTFKGLVYLVCIHGAFFTGMCLGEGMTVHYKVPPGAQGWQRVNLSYVAQVGSGIWALPALLQARRVEAPDNSRSYNLSGPMTAPFQGLLEASGPGNDGMKGPFAGTVSLEPVQGPTGTDIKGTFRGTLNGRPVELALANGFELDRPIGASPGRMLRVRMERRPDDHPHLDLTLRGTIPRPLWNWYEVPPETPQLQEFIGRLGKYWELAQVFTWIAGLLNILVIWDCVQGPSLGFGDEHPAAPDAATKPDPVSSAPVPGAASGPSVSPPPAQGS